VVAEAVVGVILITLPEVERHFVALEAIFLTMPIQSIQPLKIIQPKDRCCLEVILLGVRREIRVNKAKQGQQEPQAVVGPQATQVNLHQLFVIPF
jgi:hypothetical protein